MRCKKIVSGLQRISPDVASELESWGLAPHVLLLRWLRLLFLRELKFPTHVLTAWDAIFADVTEPSKEMKEAWAEAYRSNEEVAQVEKEVLPSSAALPLVDYLALAHATQS